MPAPAPSSTCRVAASERWPSEYGLPPFLPFTSLAGGRGPARLLRLPLVPRALPDVPIPRSPWKELRGRNSSSELPDASGQCCGWSESHLHSLRWWILGPHPPSQAFQVILTLSKVTLFFRTSQSHPSVPWAWDQDSLMHFSPLSGPETCLPRTGQAVRPAFSGKCLRCGWDQEECCQQSLGTLRISGFLRCLITLREGSFLSEVVIDKYRF